MEQAVFEPIGQQMEDATHQENLAAFGLADALGASFSSAQRAARDCAEDATELFFQTKRRLQRLPNDSFLVTLSAGIVAGTVIGWMLNRELSQKHNAA
jgi:hypothetical protein